MADFRPGVPDMPNWVPVGRETASGERIPKLLLRIGEFVDVKLWGKSQDQQYLDFSELSFAKVMAQTVDPSDPLITILRLSGESAGIDKFAALDPANGWAQAHLDIEVLADGAQPSPPKPAPAALPRSSGVTEGDGECVIDRYPDFETVAVGAKVRYSLREVTIGSPSIEERGHIWFVFYEPRSGAGWFRRIFDEAADNKPKSHTVDCLVQWDRPGVHKIVCQMYNPREDYAVWQVVRPLAEIASKAFAASKPVEQDPVHAAETAHRLANKKQLALDKYPNDGTPAQRDDEEDLIHRLDKWSSELSDILRDSVNAKHHPVKAVLQVTASSETIALSVFFVKLDGGLRWRLVDYTDPELNHRSDRFYEVVSSSELDPDGQVVDASEIAADEAIPQLISQWESRNRYHSGRVHYEFAALPSESLTARSSWFDTDGSNTTERIADFLNNASIASLALAAIGTVLLPVPIAGAVVAELMLWSLVTGIASGALTTFNRVHTDEQTRTDTVIDVLQVATLLLPGAAWATRGARIKNLAAFSARAARMNEAVFFGSLENTAGALDDVASVATTLNGMLVGANVARDIVVLTDPSTPCAAGERLDRLQHLVKDAIAGGLILIIPRASAERELLNDHERQINDRIGKLKDSSQEIPLRRPPGETHAGQGKHERTVDTGKKPRTQAPPKVPTPSPPAAAKPKPPPKYKTTPLKGMYKGEHLKGNPIWPGDVVEYLDANARQAYKLHVKGGKLYDSAGNLFDTSVVKAPNRASGGSAIFVMDENGDFYASKTQIVGKFHHSSLLAGAPVAAAGTIEVINGQIRGLSDRSGHYRPANEFTRQAVDSLQRQGVDTSALKLEMF